MQFVIVTHRNGKTLYRTKKLVKRLQERGVPTRVLSAESATVSLGHGSWALLDEEGATIRPTLVLNALHTSSDRGIVLLETLEALRVPVVNRTNAWRRAKTKPLTSLHLHRAGIPHPRVYFRYGGSGLAKTIPDRLFPLVIKPWKGSLGRRTYRLKDRSSLRRHLKRQKSRHTTLYAQPFIPNPGRDIRVMVLGTQALGATYRLAPPGKWKTNVAGGGTPLFCKVTPELAQLAIRATRALGLDLAGVDIIESPHGLMVLEVNAWPEYKRFDSTVGIDVADRIAKFLINLAPTPPRS